MQLNNYKITFKGEISSGFNSEKVKQDISLLFKLDTNKLHKIFSGNTVILKKDISHEQAQKYQDKLQSLGLIVYLEEEEMAFSVVEDTPEDLKAISPIYHPPLNAQQAFSRAQDSQSARHDSYVARSQLEGTPDCFNFDFSGRIGRLTFLNYSLLVFFMLVFSGVLAVFSFFIGIILMLMYTPFFFILTFRTANLRLHDLNISGWLSLIMFVPIVGFIFFFCLLFFPGSTKENDYGRPVEQGSFAGLIIFIGLLLIAVIGSVFYG